MAELIHMIPSIEPKLVNRFFVKYPKPFDIHNMATHKVSPLIYDCVKNEWKDITLELYDGYMIESAYTVPWSEPERDKRTYEPVSNAIVKAFNQLKSKSSKKLTLQIEKLVATGQTVERWTVIGHIKNVGFGELNYNTNEVSSVKILFKVDKATLKLL